MATTDINSSQTPDALVSKLKANGDSANSSPAKATSPDTTTETPKANGNNGSASKDNANATDTPAVNRANGVASRKANNGTHTSIIDVSISIVHNRPSRPKPTKPAPAVVQPPKTLQENIQKYQWAYGPDQVAPGVGIPYPPHAVWEDLPQHERKEMYEIFDPAVLQSVQGVLSGADMLYFRLPSEADLEGDWSLRDLAEANRRLYEEYKAMEYSGDDNLNPLLKNNIADRDDWYTDATFAQQHFTGTNPTTITLASGAWISRFKQVAKEQGHRENVKLLEEDAGSFYVQDNSYFRAAMRLNAKADLKSTPMKPEEPVRYACASVSLFRLEANGMLHPVAIIIDYRGDMTSSVTIFNRRIYSSDGTAYEETEWPWRYAKMCAQSSDWLRHEVTIHLTNTHLIEEAVIVSAHRTLRPDHPVFQIMKEHWATTLSVNFGARMTLLPGVILPLAGIGAPELVQFTNHAYESFDWESLYIPNDLNSRGFPMLSLEHNPKYKDYAYGRNMALMWSVLRKFVASHISKSYEGSDSKVAEDAELSAFCAEMRGAARINSFPEVKTVEELIDMVTMCIHIAAPQHTAVNYLQHYYQVFVPNKPPALYKPLPKTHRDLLSVDEKFITSSLPGVKNIKDWQLAAMLPFLLSEEVAGDQSFMKYAENLAKGSTLGLEEAGKILHHDLQYLKEKFRTHSLDLAEHHPNTWYMVMDPSLTAKSILI